MSELEERILDKVSGVLLGAVAGDALGLPSDGMRPYQVQRRFQHIESYYPSSSGKAGVYSGPGQLVLTQAASIEASGGVDAEMNAELMSKTQSSGKSRWGLDTFEGVRSLLAGTPYGECGSQDSFDPEFVLIGVPIGVLSAFSGMTRREHKDACKEVFSVSNRNPPAMLAGIVLSWFLRDLIVYDSFDVDELCIGKHSRLCDIVEDCYRIESSWEGYRDPLWERLSFVSRNVDQGRSVEEFVGLTGNSKRTWESVPFALFCFLSSIRRGGKTEEGMGAVRRSASMGGASPVNSSLVGAMLGAYYGLGYLDDWIMESTESSPKIMDLSRRMAQKMSSPSAEQEEDEDERWE